jgi:hypothetical protein
VQKLGNSPEVVDAGKRALSERRPAAETARPDRSASRNVCRSMALENPNTVTHGLRLARTASKYRQPARRGSSHDAGCPPKLPSGRHNYLPCS